MDEVGDEAPVVLPGEVVPVVLPGEVTVVELEAPGPLLVDVLSV